MQITIEVPDRLGEQLQQLGDRLPEALDRRASASAESLFASRRLGTVSQTSRLPKL
jgi:hypothetical protein